MAHEGYHEPVEKLTEKTKNLHKAIVSLIEELEAVDWYQQRVDTATDEALARILAHNRDEEKEHAAMLMEYIRRQDPEFAAEMKTYLFGNENIDITEIETQATE
ncbi:MAG: ferritin [Firmicutes bacterium]|nr:ferritin [Bacillota bacterium]